VIAWTGERAVGDIADSPAPADASSFDEWVRPHWRAMSIVAERLAGPLAEDVLPDALLNAWRKRHQYDPSRGRVVTWLLAIVADQAFKSARWHRRRPVTVPPPDDFTHPQTTANTDPADRLDVERALHALTDRQRTAVLLHYAIGLPLADIAVVLGCSAGTVKSTLRDARSRLRPLLLSSDHPEDS